MTSVTTILIIGIFFVTACLTALYMLARLINNRSNYIADISIASKNEEKCAEEIIPKSNIKRNRTNDNKDKNHISNEQDTTVKVTYNSNGSKSEQIDEEDDIIALAVLKGYDITKIRRKDKSPTKKINMHPSKCVFETETDSKIDAPVSKYNSLSEALSIEFSLMKSTVNSDDIEVLKSKSRLEEESNEWNHIRTREEEAIRSLKAKIDSLKNELKDSHDHRNQASRFFEQAQRRVNLLEYESKEQEKIFYSAKASNEAQIASLNVINREMAAKLATIEADTLNVSLTRTELGRAKDVISRLQIDFENIQEERSELLVQLSENKRENGELRNQAYLVDALTGKCKRLEESFEESRREFNLQVENYKSELKLTRAKLEGEISFHRAEHANSVGSSTALHQEIAQLKADVNAFSIREAEFKLKSDDLEKCNSQLTLNLEDLRSSEKYYQNTIRDFEQKLNDANEKINHLNSDFERESADLADIKAKFDGCISNCTFLQSELNNALAEIVLRESNIEILNSELQAKHMESDTLNTNISMTSFDVTDIYCSKELETLRDQLAEAEINISGLQSDLAREIKRADISKRVYEAKLSELKKE